LRACIACSLALVGAATICPYSKATRGINVELNALRARSVLTGFDVAEGYQLPRPHS
jgi:hypothetical protein